MVRDPERAEDLRAMGVEVVRGDVLDAAAFVRATAGRDVVFHTAAAVTPSGGWDAFQRPNVEGTRNAIDATAAAGARMVHVSSVAVYGSVTRYRTDGPTDEDTPLAPLSEGDFYARSKRESEAMVLGAHQEGRLWATAVRPDVIYGRYDRQFVPRVATLLRRVAPIIGGGRTTLAVVHAANVADGMVRAAVTDRAGGRAYNLANDFDVTSAEFFRLGAMGMGITLRRVPVPLVVARGAESFIRTIAPLLSRSGIKAVSFSAVDFLTRNNPFSSQRARRELAWNPTVRPETSVPEAFRWWADHR